MTQPDADPLVGRTVAHYEIVARLGGGGMGVVYHAIDRKLDRSVALKFLPQQWSHDDGAKQRFLREAQAASATAHPNICTIHDIATADDGQLFIVMAHYSGETLKQRLEAGPLPIEDALDIATQVADGLARAHAQGVVHRDIKPGNLILTEDGVRIVDFGLATFADALQLTVEGSTLGTAAYMSPEQVRGQEVDARSDVWAVGVVLYQMLAGHPPFRGVYAEAISHAIRHEPPPPLRAGRPDIPEDVEQIVFRALHKDPAIRFQNGRDLARALRQVRGLTVPMDLRTQVVIAPTPAASPRRVRRRHIVTAAVVMALLTGVPAWTLLPIERVSIAVVPVANQSGDADLNPYRLALTREIIASLADARIVRVVPYDRLLQIVRGVRAAGGDVSGPDVLAAIAKETEAQVIVVPTLLWDAGAWRMKVEYHDPRTATPAASDETPPMVSSLAKVAAYDLAIGLSERVRGHFATEAPRRVSWSDRVRAWFAPGGQPHATRFRTLDAAAAFAQGLDAYELQEYAAALSFFTAASEQDPGHPLPPAWRSRVATIMRQDDEAAAAALQATPLVTDATPLVERLFTQAVAFEARREYAAADAVYTELIERVPDEPAWRLERGTFLDRRGRTQEAIDSHIQAASADDRLPRPRVELCRQYNRLGDRTKAVEHATAALSRYDALHHTAGQALARLCMADALRLGSDEERGEARAHAEAAVTALQGMGAEYSLARAHYYVAMIAGMQGDFAAAFAAGDRALAAARHTRNAVLEPLVLMNLGVDNARARRRAPALDYYRQSSALFEALGDNARAAQNYLNAGVLVIEFGGNLDDGLRDVQNALAVVSRSGDKIFEISCRHAIATYYAHRARPAEAERELNRAIALAGERKVQEILPSLTIDLAMTYADRNQFDRAVTLLTEAIGDGSGPDAPRASVRRAEVRLRAGDAAAAAVDLDRAEKDMAARGNTALRPLLYLRRGEQAYRSGRVDKARLAFESASALWIDDLPDAASVEARAWLGLLDVGAGRVKAGSAALENSLAQSRIMGRLSLEARIRALQAQADDVLKDRADR